MNKPEIMSALNAVREAGMNFTTAFNRLADVVEAMATREEELHAEIKRAETTVAHKNDRIAALNKDNAETYQRATKAEGDAWNLTQEQTRLKNQIEVQERSIKQMDEAIGSQQRELEELRPFRTRVDQLHSELASRELAITLLRDEVLALHEVILNVATSVDKIVNPPAKPQAVSMIETKLEPQNMEQVNTTSRYQETPHGYSYGQGHAAE